MAPDLAWVGLLAHGAPSSMSSEPRLVTWTTSPSARRTAELVERLAELITNADWLARDSTSSISVIAVSCRRRGVGANASWARPRNEKRPRSFSNLLIALSKRWPPARSSCPIAGSASRASWRKKFEEFRCGAGAELLAHYSAHPPEAEITFLVEGNAAK